MPPTANQRNDDHETRKSVQYLDQPNFLTLNLRKQLIVIFRTRRSGAFNNIYYY